MLQDFRGEGIYGTASHGGVGVIFEEGGKAIEVRGANSVGRGLSVVHAIFEAEDHVGLCGLRAEEAAASVIPEELVLGF